MYLTKTEATARHADMLTALCGPACNHELRAAIARGESFELQTKAGTLRGCAYAPERVTPNGRKWSAGWIHLRFDDVQRARLTLPHDTRLNPYSGKWNWMETHREEAMWLENALEFLRAEFLKTV
jgi:hypothetical protein